MNSYHIVERNMDMTYIELRLLMEVECDLKADKITQILVFLNSHGFINCLTIFNPSVHPENIIEQDNVMSLTIDMVKDRLRFKFWDGASVMWLYHTQDLFDALDTNRKDFNELYDKYEPVTEVLLKQKKIWSLFIEDILYQYHPNEDVEVVYEIVLIQEAKKSAAYDKIVASISNDMDLLDKNEGFKFNIIYTFREIVCGPCERARREREKNENK